MNTTSTSNRRKGNPSYLINYYYNIFVLISPKKYTIKFTNENYVRNNMQKYSHKKIWWNFVVYHSLRKATVDKIVILYMT